MSLILVLNAGSSSVKCALIDADGKGAEREIARGSVDGIGQSATFAMKFNDTRPPLSETFDRDRPTTHKDAIGLILKTIDSLYGLDALKAVGHRVVHGGAHFRNPVRMDQAALAELRKLIPLAPLHQPHNLAPIDSLFDLSPDLVQVACFDTAFHATIPDVARNFALPKALTEKGIRRYGFHGLSYNYIAQKFLDLRPDLAHERVIVAHLGNGASLCGMKQGQSLVSTMGFSALDGLMMGTRTGSLDPAVIFYLMREDGMSADAVEKLLYSQSGLLGVSGLSNDMRTLRNAAPDHADARLALDMFTYRVIREIGSIAAALNGVDALIFTAGIGEHDARLRADVIEGLSHLGFTLDHDANAQHKFQITRSTKPPAFVIPTNEEALIARATAACITPI